jgi:hypothetical protein
MISTFEAPTEYGPDDARAHAEKVVSAIMKHAEKIRKRPARKASRGHLKVCALDYANSDKERTRVRRASCDACPVIVGHVRSWEIKRRAPRDQARSLVTRTGHCSSQQRMIDCKIITVPRWLEPFPLDLNRNSNRGFPRTCKSDSSAPTVTAGAHDGEGILERS